MYPTKKRHLCILLALAALLLSVPTAQGQTRDTLTERTLNMVTINASRSSSRYSRKDNPAVELIRQVIAHKEANRISNQEHYWRNGYEKVMLALDDFHPDFEHKFPWRKLQFLQKYIDRSPFDGVPILTISMREMMMEQSQRGSHSQRTLVTARRMEGLDQMLGQEGIDATLGSMFAPIDIYDNDIEIMANHFIGPLSSNFAIAFYKFFITDTCQQTVIYQADPSAEPEERTVPCVEVSFVPVTKESFGFSGLMHIALDGSYAVIHYDMHVSSFVNINFVRDLTIAEDYALTASQWVPYRSDNYARLFLHRRLQNVYAHHTRLYHHYNLNDTAPQLPDSLFSPLSNTAVSPNADKMRRREWNSLRPLELTAKETVLDSMRYELARMPAMQVLRKVGEITLFGYIPTAHKRDDSYFDIGPIYNFYSYNHEEGDRLRLGGMTTARLNPHHFGEGYVAYSFGDRRWKYSASYTYTFDEKKHHSHEAPRNLLNIGVSHELETPGQSFEDFERDNIMMSSEQPQRVQYVSQVQLRLRKEWEADFKKSHAKLSLDTWLAARSNEPAGLLEYNEWMADGSLRRVDHFEELEWMCKLGFSPRQASDSRRSGSGNMTSLNLTAPRISLTHRVGLMGDALFGSQAARFPYQRTDLSIQKNIWLSAFGYLDTRVNAGIVWGRVPFPKLYIPGANSSMFLSSSAFNTMQPLEFIMDRYASLFATYHLKGLILRHIPLVRRLKLREVVSFSILWGGLTDKNWCASTTVADGGNREGLYQLPNGVSPLGSTPYMEWSVGVENILKFIRIDYVRRLSYTEGLTDAQKGSIRIQLRFTL